jgi:hypothetical protein
VIGRLGQISRPSLPVNRWPLSLLADVRTIADSTRVLPDVLERLPAIEPRVESIDREVAGIRQGVESIGVHVIDLRDSIHPIQRTAERLGRISDRIPRGSRAR